MNTEIEQAPEPTPEDDFAGFNHWAQVTPSADCWRRVAEALWQDHVNGNGSIPALEALTPVQVNDLIKHFNIMAAGAFAAVFRDTFDLLWEVLPDARVVKGEDGLWLVHDHQTIGRGNTPKEAAVSAIMAGIVHHAPLYYDCPVAGPGQSIPGPIRVLIWQLRFGSLAEVERDQLWAWVCEQPVSSAGRLLEVPVLAWIDSALSTGGGVG